MSPSSGSGTGTPIGGGVGAGLNIAQPIPRTILSLNKYAKVMGINPAHLWGSAAPEVAPGMFPTTCDSIWYQYSWQDADKVSRFDLALAIKGAEEDIANVLGYFPGPVWIADEHHAYPRVFMREYEGTGIDVRGRVKSINTKWGNVIAAGRRATTLIATATTGGGTLTYSDEDSDGFYETATIQVATTLTDTTEIKVYHYDTDAAMEWEIREPRSISISGGFVTLIFDSWLFVDPELYMFMPDVEGAEPIDISTTANFVTSVDVYREYTDATQNSAVFYWENQIANCTECGGLGCEVCTESTQNGCLAVRDRELGVVVPSPGTYDATNGWTGNNWSYCVQPDRVSVWYKCGLISDEYRAGRTTDPVSWEWAQTIAFLASARLERPPCQCANLHNVVERLRTEITQNSRDTGSFFTSMEIVGNPFGTRYGEILAWRKVVRSTKRKRLGVAVI